MPSVTGSPDRRASQVEISKMPVATVGARVMVPMPDSDELLLAEILSVKQEPDGIYQYYVHWTDFNRRLDAWVGSERMDLQSVSYGGLSSRDIRQLESKTSTSDSDVGG